MNNQDKARLIIDQMMAGDAFSQWLGIERLEEGPGFCSLQMTLRAEMVNGFSIAHGGITFSLADSALAFAANSHGEKAVSVDTQISHLRPVQVGDKLTARATEVHRSRRLGVYDVAVVNQDQKKVALFKGHVLFTGEHWSV